MTTLRFSSWVQPGTGAALGAVDPADGAPDDPPPPAARALLTPMVRVTDTIGGGTKDAGGPGLEVLGPSAVVALAAGQVVGRFPVPGAVGTEAVNLAAVEFGTTDLPWRFSPARAGAGERLRPWLVLVVVPATVEVVPGVPAARMSVAPAELPDLRESWAWAHAQLDDDGAGGPARGRSRILCPRKLPANARLRAAVVPAFLGGVQAGLGAVPDPNRVHEPAWKVDDAAPVTLPVYEHWEFTTGADADFEALAGRIQPARPSELGGFGFRMVDLSAPWTGDDPLPGEPAVAALGGALRPLGPPPHDHLTAEQDGELRRRLADDLDASADGDLGPPLRGGQHANRTTIATTGGDWADQLNRDPLRRLAAGRGADWVLCNQEQLMAKAWLQAGEIREAARRLALGRASVAITDSLQRRHLDHLSGDELIAVTAPAAARARLDGSNEEPTLGAILGASAAPDGATSTVMARVMRPAGILARASGSRQLMSRAVAGKLTDANRGTWRSRTLPSATAAPGATAAGTTLVGQLGARQTAATITAVATAASSLWVSAKVAAREDVEQPLELFTAIADDEVWRGGPDVVASQLGTQEMRSSVATAIAHDRLGPAVLGLGVAADVAAPVAIHPDGLRIADAALPAVVRSAMPAGAAVRMRIGTTVTAPSGQIVATPDLDPVLPTPEVPAPMAMALIERDPEWFLPGIGGFPVDRATLLSPDDGFVEAVLVGANVELLAEFLWREFPTDRRGTPIAQFWPRPGGEPDVGQIHRWTGDLGTHTVIDGEATAVLLVRAELLRRYPATVVLAAPAEADPDRPGRLRPVGAMDRWRTPLFTIPVDPSTRAIGFAVAPAALTAPVSAAAPGWFFVLVEPPTSIRFGFDLGPDEQANPPPPATWNDVEWGHVIDDRGFASARRPVAGPPGGAVWGGPTACSADVARIALQRPVRIALHASRMVG